MDLGLDGKVALVTGGSAGIGLGVARALAAEGAVVVVTSRAAERAGETAAALGGGARGYGFDSEDLESVVPLCEAIEGDLGPIDVYVANTGGPPGGQDPLGFTRVQWESAHRQLVLSTMAFLERLLPGMRSRGWGRVILIASSTVKEPIDTLQLSNAHRPGLVAAFKVLARQSAPDGVTLNTILPGRIATDRIADVYGSIEAAQETVRHEVPAGRLGTTEEIGAATAFLCSAPASYVTGTTLLVDGGLTRGV
jgi:3-oxoacyl-[acyl-carrier protein] reductase